MIHSPRDCAGCGVALLNVDLCPNCQRAIDWLNYFLVWAGGLLTEKQIHQRVRRLRRMNEITGVVQSAVRDGLKRAGIISPLEIMDATKAMLEKNAEFCELLRQELVLSDES